MQPKAHHPIRKLAGWVLLAGLLAGCSDNSLPPLSGEDLGRTTEQADGQKNSNKP